MVDYDFNVYALEIPADNSIKFYLELLWNRKLKYELEEYGNTDDDITRMANQIIRNKNPKNHMLVISSSEPKLPPKMGFGISYIYHPMENAQIWRALRPDELRRLALEIDKVLNGK